MPNQVRYTTSLAYKSGKSDKVWGALVLDNSVTCQLITVWGPRNGTKMYKRQPTTATMQAFADFSAQMQVKINEGYAVVPPGHANLGAAFDWLRHQTLTNNFGTSAVAIGTPDTLAKSPKPVSKPVSKKHPFYDDPEPDLVAGCTGCLIRQALDTGCQRCQQPTSTHTTSHPHASAICAGFVGIDTPKPDPVSIDSSPVAHQECRCGHCMSSHGQVDQTVSCLVAGCRCEAYRYQCGECGTVSTTGGWNHTDDCVTGYRLRPERRADGTRRQPRRTSDLITDDL